MRFEKKAESGSYSASVVFIAALNILFLSVFVFYFQAHVGAAGYGIETVLAPQSGNGRVIEIVVAGEGRVRVNGSVITLDELKGFLGQLRGCACSFLVVSGQRAAFEQVARVLELCRRAGAQKVFVVTQPAQELR